MKTNLKSLGFMMMFFMASCVDLYDPGLTSDVRRLVIECQLTTENQYQYVYLTFDAPYNSDETNFRNLVRRAKVKVIDDKGLVQDFYDEIEPNNSIKTVEGFNYRSINKFKADLARKYKLTVELLDGRKYESSFEGGVPVPPVDKVYWEYKELPAPSKLKGNFNVFLNVKDPKSTANFYKWDSYHVKQINYCREWYIFGTGGGVTQSFLDNCCQPCYEKVKCDECFEIANDKLIDGNSILKQFVTGVPYDNDTPYYLIINQYSLNEFAYKYWNAIKEQAKNSGGLFDATPKSIKGNIKNINNDKEEVLGIFYVSDVYKHQVNINRNLGSPKPIVIPDYSDFWIRSGNCYPCQETWKRTKEKPSGWIN